MKNLLMLLFFGAVVIISGIFTKKTETSSVRLIVNSAIVQKEFEKKLLMKDLNDLVIKNTKSIDSIKNN